MKRLQNEQPLVNEWQAQAKVIERQSVVECDTRLFNNGENDYEGSNNNQVIEKILRGRKENLSNDISKSGRDSEKIFGHSGSRVKRNGNISIDEGRKNTSSDNVRGEDIQTVHRGTSRNKNEIKNESDIKNPTVENREKYQNVYGKYAEEYLKNKKQISDIAPKTSKKIKEKKHSKEKEGYLKAKKDAAYAILSKATGKKVAWLKMQKNKSLEKIQNLIANVDDKLLASDFDPSWTEYYSDLNKLNDNGNESIGVDYEIASKVLDDIINDNFYEENKYSDMTTEDFIAMTEYDIENIKSQIKTQLIKDLIKDETEITEDIFNRAYSLLNTSETSEEYLLDFEEDINLLNEIYDNQKLLISLHEELEKTKNNIHNDNEVLNENTRRNNRRNKAKSTTNETGNNERTVNGAVSEFENGNVLRTSNNSNVNNYEQNEENITRNVKNEKSKGRKSSTKENKTTHRNDKKTLEDEIKEIAPKTVKKQELNAKIEAAKKELQDNKFIPDEQKEVLMSNLNGSEKDFFVNKINEIKEIIDNAPKTAEKQLQNNNITKQPQNIDKDGYSYKKSPNGFGSDKIELFNTKGENLGYADYRIGDDAIDIDYMSSNSIEKGVSDRLVTKLIKENPNKIINWDCVSIESEFARKSFIKKHPDMANKIQGKWYEEVKNTFEKEEGIALNNNSSYNFNNGENDYEGSNNNQVIEKILRGRKENLSNDISKSGRDSQRIPRYSGSGIKYEGNISIDAGRKNPSSDNVWWANIQTVHRETSRSKNRIENELCN